MLDVQGLEKNQMSIASWKEGWVGRVQALCIVVKTKHSASVDACLRGQRAGRGPQPACHLAELSRRTSDYLGPVLFELGAPAAAANTSVTGASAASGSRWLGSCRPGSCGWQRSAS